MSITGFHTFPLSYFQVKEILYFIWSLFYCQFFNKERLASVLHFVMLQVVRSVAAGLTATIAHTGYC